MGSVRKKKNLPAQIPNTSVKNAIENAFKKNNVVLPLKLKKDLENFIQDFEKQKLTIFALKLGLIEDKYENESDVLSALSQVQAEFKKTLRTFGFEVKDG